MKFTEIAYSCYAVSDIAKARAFYEGVLGLKVTMESDMGDVGHWVEYDIGSGTLAIGRTAGWKPSADGCSVALEAEDLDEALAELKAADVPFKMEVIETPVCHMAIVLDPDGNPLIIHKRKPGHH
jgi:catechol 2,3-dioxygenase-like lactoylglutathione lyase family enzyme